MSEILKKMVNLFCIDILSKYEKDLINSVRETNINRLFSLSLFFLCIEVIIIVFRFLGLFSKGAVLNALYIESAFKAWFVLIFIFVFGFIIKKGFSQTPYSTILSFIFLFGILIFQVFLTKNEVESSGTIYTFGIGLLIIAMAPILFIKQTITVIFFYSILTTAQILNINKIDTTIINSLIYIFFFAISAAIGSRLHFVSYVNNFIITKELLERKLELEQIVAQLEQLSTTDQLTGINNRRGLDDKFETFWNQCLREFSSIAIIIADIDKFKLYNDTYGHLAGDNVISSVGRVFKKVLKRSTDIAGRYGGEEFIAVLPFTETIKAYELAEKLRIEVAKLKIKHEKSPNFGYVTISTGVCAIVPNNVRTPKDLIDFADQALYEAKKQGGNLTKIKTFEN